MMKNPKPDYEQLALAFLDLFEGIKVHELPKTGLSEGRCQELVEMKMIFINDEKIRKDWSKLAEKEELKILGV